MIWQATVVFAARSVIMAGLYASAIILLAGIAQISYTAEPWLLIPAMFGAFAGTTTAVMVT